MMLLNDLSAFDGSAKHGVSDYFHVCQPSADIWPEGCIRQDNRRNQFNDIMQTRFKINPKRIRQDHNLSNTYLNNTYKTSLWLIRRLGEFFWGRNISIFPSIMDYLYKYIIWKIYFKSLNIKTYMYTNNSLIHNFNSIKHKHRTNDHGHTRSYYAKFAHMNGHWKDYDFKSHMKFLL